MFATIYKDNGSVFVAEVELESDVELAHGALYIDAVTGNTAVFNWDAVDRFVISEEPLVSVKKTDE